MPRLNPHRLHFLLLILGLFGCSRSYSTINTSLPRAEEMFSARGYRVARTSIHLHSPISYDTCGSLTQAACMSDLRTAICKNRLDLVHLTDHPDHMADTPFEELLLHQEGDESIVESGTVIGNLLHCENSHQAIVMAGFENQLMPIGMIKHLEPLAADRQGLYIQATPDLVNRLKSEAQALVVIPHTESRSIETIRSLNPNAIEVYNLHANVNPKIRNEFLGLDYFDGLIDLLVFWIDPYGHQEPDYAFLSFLKVGSIYSKVWSALLAGGNHMVGLGGNDAHESLFPGNGSDGEKLDSYRRVTRWITNHFLVKNLNITEAKEAIQKGRGWLAFEGLGTPTDFDFYGSNATDIFELGDTISLSSTHPQLIASIPKLYIGSPQETYSPAISMILKRVDTGGNETVVVESTQNSIQYPLTEPGAYRIEVSIVPNHLRPFVGYKKDLTLQEYKWIITNHIYVTL